MERREIPSVNSILEKLDINQINLPRENILFIIKNKLSHLRRLDKKDLDSIFKKDITNEIINQIKLSSENSLSKVINGTGIVLHTGLGRAPISKDILFNLAEDLSGYTNLEFDVKNGNRSERLTHVSNLISSIVESESSIVVNNNAAAVMLAINTLAHKKEIIISRGQLIEIGGSFRIPDVINQSGAFLKEVGTTNRTHLIDYSKAINKHTGAIMYAHTSNYKIEGFTKEVEIKDLVKLSKKNNIPLIVDLGSGALLDFKKLNLPTEPLVKDIINLGVSLVTFSSDKLIGGPQSGIISGEKNIIDKLHQNPIYRSLRCDKFIISILERTLRLHDFDNPNLKIESLKLLSASRKLLKKKGDEILNKIKNEKIKELNIKLEDSLVEAGSGSLPIKSIESVCFKFKSSKYKSTEIARYFRNLNPPIIGYIKKNYFHIDLKAILDDQLDYISSSINSI